MKKSSKTYVAAAAVAGLLAGVSLNQANAASGDGIMPVGEEKEHKCGGKDGCPGKKDGCSGKGGCPGKGESTGGGTGGEGAEKGEAEGEKKE